MDHSANVELKVNVPNLAPSTGDLVKTWSTSVSSKMDGIDYDTLVERWRSKFQNILNFATEFLAGTYALTHTQTQTLATFNN